MNKSELVNAIAGSAQLTKADSEKALNGFLETITETLKKGDAVSLVGFGSFDVKHRPKHKGCKPANR